MMPAAVFTSIHHCFSTERQEKRYKDRKGVLRLPLIYDWVIGKS